MLCKHELIEKIHQPFNPHHVPYWKCGTCARVFTEYEAQTQYAATNRLGKRLINGVKSSNWSEKYRPAFG